MVNIHLNQFSAWGDNDVNANGQPRNLVFYHHNQKIEENYDPYAAPTVPKEDKFTFNTTSNIKTYIYSSGVVEIPFGGRLFGSVTARQLFMLGESEIIYSGELYGEQLHISPETYAASACEKIAISFSVKDSNGNLNSQAEGLLSVAISSKNDDACWINPNDASDTCHPKRIDNVMLKDGQASLLLAGMGGSIDVVGSFVPSSINVKELIGSAGPYSFSPSGYTVNNGRPIEIIAGKGASAPIKAVKSVGAGLCETEDSIQGKIFFTTTTNYERPKSGTKKALVNGNETDDPNGVTGVDFKNGEGQLEVNYFDAGHVSVDLEVALSPNADDALDAENQRRPKPETPPEKGRANIYARPYTLAICNAGTVLPDEEDIGLERPFLRAGERFNLALRPIIWSKDHMVGPKAASIIPWRSEHCLVNKWADTPNFWKSDAPPTTVALSPTAAISSPPGGESVTIGEFSKAHTEAVNGRYKFTGIAVDDVGTYRFYSKLGSTYLGMEVTPSEREVGRFYPSHFGIASEFKRGVDAAYDEDGNGFTYLDQPFSGEFSIHAMDINDKPVSNYHRYTGATDKAKFEDWVIDSVEHYPYDGTDLSSRWDGARLNSARWAAGTGGVSEVKVSGNMMIRKGNREDGPFAPLRFAVGVATNDRDNTAFELCANDSDLGCSKSVIKPGETTFGAQIAEGPFFFGRMRIGGFTETQDFSGEQMLPVIVEYWNGSHFETNVRDNASFVHLAGSLRDQLVSNSKNIETQIQWQNGSTAEGKESVSQGVYNLKVVPQQGNKAVPFREQFRFWQCLAVGCEVDETPISGFIEQPWLQYGWESATELKKTSGLVTYGHYRGSDRLIYKGEKSITLTGE
ncbi:DUF6701 domain-containing protein [Enterovibrio nigricans]|uniref:DUF6701 domain-containing protein n=1 Tax=Enterovibrio nigricans TaxID=504469 RepID=UPI001FCE0DE6|nr:DUF6701 domain-containing protein [Enterovibrio nigricans]